MITRDADTSFSCLGGECKAAAYMKRNRRDGGLLRFVRSTWECGGGGRGGGKSAVGNDLNPLICCHFLLDQFLSVSDDCGFLFDTAIPLSSPVRRCFVRRGRVKW